MVIGPMRLDDLSLGSSDEQICGRARLTSALHVHGALDAFVALFDCAGFGAELCELALVPPPWEALLDAGSNLALVGVATSSRDLAMGFRHRPRVHRSWVGDSSGRSIRLTIRSSGQSNRFAIGAAA